MRVDSRASAASSRTSRRRPRSELEIVVCVSDATQTVHAESRDLVTFQVFVTDEVTQDVAQAEDADERSFLSFERAVRRPDVLRLDNDESVTPPVSDVGHD